MMTETARPSRHRWRLHLALVAVLGLIVVRNTILDSETAQERDTSDAMTGTLEALSETKLAYGPELILSPHAIPPDSPQWNNPGGGEPSTNGRKERARSSIHSSRVKRDSISINDVLSDALRSRVVARWRSLATARTGRPAEWRRLGITLFLFGRPGGLSALRHVADHFPSPRVSSASAHIPRARVDPFGHRPVPIPGAQELAMWQKIYGPRPLTAADAARYGRMLGQLRLGWFENVATGQLYVKSRQIGRARVSAEAAAQSVRLLNRLDVINTVLTAFGAIGLCVLGLFSITNRLHLPASVGEFVTSDVDVPSSWLVSPHRNRGTPRQGMPATRSPRVSAANLGRWAASHRMDLFPYGVLLLTFIMYLACQEGVGLLAGLAISPFRVRLSSLPTSTLLRVTQLVQVLAYVPIILVPLLLIRRCIQCDPRTGERLGWKRLLANIGFRTAGPAIDIGAGAIGYLLVTPAVVAAGLLSNWLFARFHTPQNPAALEMLAAQSNLDRVLILFVASVAAPFAEETFFRGILYSALRSRIGICGGAAVSSAIFALVHPTLPGGFLPIWAVGMGAALVFEWRQSLLPGIVLHGLYNGMITLTIFAVFAK